MSIDNHNAEQWMLITEAARLLDTTPLNVLMHIKRGLLAGVEWEEGWLVDPDSLAQLLRKRSEGEAPAVCTSGCSKAHGCKSCG